LSLDCIQSSRALRYRIGLTHGGEDLFEMNVRNLVGFIRVRRTNLFIIPLAIIWVSRALTLFAFPDLVTTPDSQGYLAPSTWNFANVSVLGNAERPWPTTLLYAAIPNSSIVLVQLLLSGIAATLLINSIDTFIGGAKLRFWCALVLSIFLSNPRQLEWDTVANAQSLSNSLCIFLFVTVMRITRNASKFSLGILWLEGILLSSQRLIYILIFISTSVVLLPKFVKHLRTKLIAMMIAISLFSALVSQNQNNFWPASYSGFAVIGQLNDTSPVNEEFKKFLESKGAKKCLLDGKLNALISEEAYSCTGAIAWTRSKARDLYMEFLMDSPHNLMKLQSFALYGVFTSSAVPYGNAVSILPEFVNSIFIGKRQFQDTPYMNSIGQNYFYLPGVGLLLFGLLVSRRHIFTRDAFGHRKTKYFILHALVFSNILCVFLTGPLISAEWTRILATQATMITVACILLAFTSFGDTD